MIKSVYYYGLICRLHLGPPKDKHFAALLSIARLYQCFVIFLGITVSVIQYLSFDSQANWFDYEFIRRISLIFAVLNSIMHDSVFIRLVFDRKARVKIAVYVFRFEALVNFSSAWISYRLVFCFHVLYFPATLSTNLFILI